MLHLQVFQCLLLEEENVGADALRQAEKFYVTEEQFEEFLQRHKHIPFLVAESNVKVVLTERYSVLYTDLHMLIYHFKDHNNFDIQNSLAGSLINLASVYC
jgi:hypothetical protein